MQLGKYSFGTGDRFGYEGEAQLWAMIKAQKQGIDITPVWNKSHREHQIIGTKPDDVRKAADKAVKELNWDKPYFVDADHINLDNVDEFIDASDFFTIDVADYIGKKAEKQAIDKFVESNKKYTGTLKIPGIDNEFNIAKENVRKIAEKFLFAIEQAQKIYQHIEKKKGKGKFITEISMDEVEEAQTPVEMFFILSGLAQKNIPVQTIAPKFSGRFNKGVDYVGDTGRFAKEFEEDLMVIDFAVNEFGLPESLKLSVHSGSDKFSIYPIMGKLIKKHDKGIHVKTAGTTWLEEMIGLALSEGSALILAKEIYLEALARKDELCKPYATVIDIDPTRLPEEHELQTWDGERFANELRHNQENPAYNPNFRQLIHVGYKIAAEQKEDFLVDLTKYRETIWKEVTYNLFDRHIKRLFGLE